MLSLIVLLIIVYYLFDRTLHTCMSYFEGSPLGIGRWQRCFFNFVLKPLITHSPLAIGKDLNYEAISLFCEQVMLVHLVQDPRFLASPSPLQNLHIYAKIMASVFVAQSSPSSTHRTTRHYDCQILDFIELESESCSKFITTSYNYG